MLRKFTRSASWHTESRVSLEALIKQIEHGKKLLRREELPLLKNMNIHVYNYIKEHKRIIYGGTAIKILIEFKDPEIVGNDDEFLDYDFYSPNHERDSIAIANNLHNAGFKYVRRVPALHPNTYRIGGEFASEFIADITQVPQADYDLIPKIKIKDLYYIDPQYAKIDLYISVCNPHTNTNRWIKSLKRLQKMENLYPLKFKNVLTTNNKNKNLIKYKTILKNAYITGLNAYNLMFKDNYIDHPIIEAFVLELPKIPKTMKIVEKLPYIDILDTNYEIYESDVHVLTFYKINNNCVSYTTIKDASSTHNVVSYFFLLWFLYIKYIQKKDNNIAFAINKLLNVSSDFVSLPLCEEDPNNSFCIFDTNCITKDKESVRLAPYTRFFYNKERIPLYKPSKKYIELENIK